MTPPSQDEEPQVPLLLAYKKAPPDPAAEVQAPLLLRAMKGTFSDRKWRLFLCGWCRQRYWHLLIDPRSRRAVEVAELLADGLASEEDAEAAEDAAMDAQSELGTENQPEPDWSTAVWVPSEPPATPGFVSSSGPLIRNPKTWDAAWDAYRCLASRHYGAERAVMAETALWWTSSIAVQLVRELGGVTQSAPVAGREWVTSMVAGMAESAYRDRAFDRLPVLADALEDAGCDDVRLLSHLRRDGWHVRGCWALDQILGKN